MCVEVFTPAGRSHWGNVNSLCGSLGTLFHLPSRNCSNEARHIAFHPSLPAIRHSSQFFVMVSAKCLYTQTQCSGATAAHSSPPLEPCRAAPVHTRPLPCTWKDVLVIIFRRLFCNSRHSWMLFVHAPPSPPTHFTPPRSVSQPKKPIASQGTSRKIIWL